jgi:hypothetical protein
MLGFALRSIQPKTTVTRGAVRYNAWLGVEIMVSW